MLKKAWLVYPYTDPEDYEDDGAPEFHSDYPPRWTTGRIVKIVYAVVEDPA